MMRPKSIAPKLIRFPEMPKCAMPVMAKRNASGIAVATMSAARQLPRRNSNITTTSTAPSKRFFATVWIVRSTNSLRLYCGLMITPGGKRF